MPRALIWTTEMNESLRALKAQGFGCKRIAKVIGVSPSTVFAKLREPCRGDMWDWLDPTPENIAAWQKELERIEQRISELKTRIAEAKKASAVKIGWIADHFAAR